MRIKGTSNQTTLHAMISVGRWIAAVILQNHMIKLKTKSGMLIHTNLLSFFIIHRSRVAIATDIDTAAWSEGKLLEGRKSWRIDSVLLSINHRAALGLTLSTKYWISTLIMAVMRTENPIVRAEIL